MIFSRLIFSSSEVFLSLESQGAEDLANKEGAEARQPSPVSDIRVQWYALCDEALSCNNLTPQRPVAGRRLNFMATWCINSEK